MDKIRAGTSGRDFSITAAHQKPEDAKQTMSSPQGDTSATQDTAGQNLTSMAALAAEASNNVIKVASTNSAPVDNRYAEIHEKAMKATVADVADLKEKALATPPDSKAVAVLLDIYVCGKINNQHLPRLGEVAIAAHKALTELPFILKEKTLKNASYFPGGSTSWSCTHYLRHVTTKDGGVLFINGESQSNIEF